MFQKDTILIITSVKILNFVHTVACISVATQRPRDGYTRPVSEQRLNKHIPITRQQNLNNTTVEFQQWKSCVSYVVRVQRLNVGRSLERSSKSQM